MRRGLPGTLLLLLLCASTLQGCAWRSKPSRTAPPAAAPAIPPPAKPPAAAPAIPPPAARPPVPKPPVPKPPAIPVADRLFAEGMTALQAGANERALELFSAAWKEEPGHAGVAREFDGALLALKKSGDAAYAQRKWGEAGMRWMATLRFLHHPAANGQNLSLTRSEVRTKVDKLTAALTEKALTEYRRGEVPAAIADWKTILSYDPGHEEASRSLQTATKQLETLKKLPPGK